jgi:translation elongation factor EF-Tu-like GTPase
MPRNDDFEAVIRILTEAEGGRQTPAFNGIRWDFCYASDNPASGLYMIWPDFFSASGDSLPANVPLPRGIELTARMNIVVDESRVAVHRTRIEPGVEFNCHEGARRVATGRVSRVTGLHKERNGAA